MMVDIFTIDHGNTIDAAEHENNIASLILHVFCLPILKKIFLKNTNSTSVQSYQKQYQNVRENVVNQTSTYFNCQTLWKNNLD